MIVVWMLIILLGILKFSYLQTNILSYDYFGLYLYLPATFIYHDPAISDISWLEQINATYHNTPMFYQLQTLGDLHLIRFFCGMAILLSPFFFLGHFIALLTAYPADGFSFPYQLSMAIAAFFYVALGLWFARKILLKYFDDKTTVITLISVYLGTNLLFWTTFDAGAPHTILFTLYTILIWFTIKWHERPRKSSAIIIGIILGLIIVSRPSEIIAILIPMCWNISGKESFLNKIRMVWKYRFHVILLGTAAFLMGLPQMAYFYHYTGKIFLSTYTDPQSILDLWNPRFAWVLFSYRKGWFVYAPLMVFSVIGLWWMVKRKITLALPVILFFLINLYIIASFTSLISFGYRAFIQSYALMMIPLGFGVSYLRNRGIYIRTISLVILIFFMFFSLIQVWQIKDEVIHATRMTREYYWKIFGKTKASMDDKKLLMINPFLDDETGNKLVDSLKYSKSILAFIDMNQPLKGLEKFQKLKGDTDTIDKCFETGIDMQFSPSVKIPYEQITNKDHFWARVSFAYKSDSIVNPSELVLVVTFTYRGKVKANYGIPYKYRYFEIPFDMAKVGSWQNFTIDYLSPEVTTYQDRFETYVLNKGKAKVQIDDFKVIKFEP
ncbi:MAG: hypothetical protein HOO86_06855 [Bacteroidales bacterium]|nr:hypothetical protein [Bacteroidales bacterium]